LVLETREERVKLLKAGVKGKDIEKLYIIENKFTIYNVPVSIYYAQIGKDSKLLVPLMGCN